MRTALLRFPAGFGEIACVWSKLSQATKLPQYSDVAWEAELNIDDPRGSPEFVALLPEIKLRGFGQHNTSHCLQRQLPADAVLEPHLDQPIYPVSDHFLLRGGQLADLWPELPVEYHYPLDIPEAVRTWAAWRTKHKPYVLIYPSALYRLRSRPPWGDVWDSGQWAGFVARLARGLLCDWYLIGSGRDQTMIQAIAVQVGAQPERCIISESMVETAALIKGAAYFAGFPAGPAVLAGVLATPHCIPFRNPVQRGMRGSFTDPAMLADGTAYLPYFSEPPLEVAGEILNRLPPDLRSPVVSIPSPLTGSPVFQPQPLWPLPSFDCDVPGLAATIGLPEPAAETHEQLQRLYALGATCKARCLLIAGLDAYSAAAVLLGTLDAGTGLGQLTVAGPWARESWAGLSRLCQRVAPPPITCCVEALTEPEAAKTYAFPGYQLAVIGLGSTEQERRKAWEFVAPPGWLIEAPARSDDIREALGELTYYPDSAPGWAATLK